MVAVLAAVVITAIVVGAVATRVAQRSARAAFLKSIGGRSYAEPVGEHRRLLEAAESQTADANARAEVLQLSLDALQSGVVVTDHDGTVLVRNRLAGTVADRPHERVLVDAAVNELLQQALRGQQADREIEVFGPPPRTLAISAAPVVETGRVAGALAVIDDVTDQHRIENTRRDFVANLSHELRTPVGAVSLLGELLVDEPDAAVRGQLTERLLKETDRMSATIDDLLELSRIESSTERYDDVVSVQSLVDEAIARTRVAAESAAIDIGAVGPSEPINLLGNRDQLLTALVNLVENAIKYSRAGGSVSVRSRVDEDALILAVQDNGAGIPARDLDRIFERFYRVDRSRESSTGGTGIGLSIVRHVALNHGGTVEVDSLEGDGSTFTITLPLVSPQPQSEAIERESV